MIDHRGEASRRIANVRDLRAEAFARGVRADQFGQHFGTAEDHAERILQVVSDGAENFVLESIGALKPQPLRRKAAIGQHQRARALRDAVLQLRVGFVQLLIEDHVVEGDRQPAAEDFHQRAIGFRERALGLQQHDNLATAAGADIQHRALVGELVLATAECFLDHLPQIGVERSRPRVADEPAVATGACEHREIVADLAAVAQHEDAGAIDVE